MFSPLGAVDKSTELLGTSNQITLETVFNKLDQFIIRSFQSPNQVRPGDAELSDIADLLWSRAG